MLVRWPWRKNRSTSLFIKLLTSFLIVILLPLSFNFLSYTFFRDTIKQEIVKNSSLNLNAVATNYEQHITLIKNVVLGFYFNDRGMLLKNAALETNYEVMYQVRGEITSTLTNPLLYLNNIIYFFKDEAYVIGKEGSGSAHTVFSKLYYHPEYGADFWKGQIEQPHNFKIYPNAEFKDRGLSHSSASASYIPILIKNVHNPKFALIAFLEGQKLFEASGRSEAGLEFHILDDGLRSIFANAGSPLPAPVVSNMTAASGHILEGDKYYFYQRGPQTGLMYVNVVPYHGISRQIARLNAILAVLMGAGLLLCFAASVFFSVKLNSPVVRLLASLQELALPRMKRTQTKIREFDLLGEKVDDLVRANREIRADLHNKNSLLTYYACTNKLKNIYTGYRDLKIPTDTNKPYMLLLCKLEFKDSINRIAIDPDRATGFIREYIGSHLAKPFADSLTFQIERDQIFSILFPGGQLSSAVDEAIGDLCGVLDLDQAYCSVTIAVSPVYTGSSHFDTAYERLGEMIRLRRLGTGSQVIRTHAAAPPPVELSPSEEEELQANLKAGNDSVVLALLERKLSQMARRQATLLQVREFAQEVMNRAVKASYAMSVKPDEANAACERCGQCETVEQFEQLLRDFIGKSAAAIRLKKSETDAITHFVANYVEAHYGDDITLELIADKLNISGAYLSTYFKDKTGTNFSDFVNAYRMNKAKDMLANSGLKIQDVAGLVGYPSVNSFNRVFKKHTGLTPGEFRRRARQSEYRSSS